MTPILNGREVWQRSALKSSVQRQLTGPQTPTAVTKTGFNFSICTIPVDLTLDQLKPFHVQRWIDRYLALSDGTKRNYCRTIQRAMAWAEEQGNTVGASSRDE